MRKEYSGSLKGIWWLPERPERQVTGEILAGGDEAGLTVMGELFGLTEHAVPPDFVMWGNATDGESYTLFGCSIRRVSRTFGHGSLPTAEVSTPLWLSGGHYRSLDDVRLSLLCCELTHLVQWVGHGAYSTSVGDNFSTITIVGKKPNPIPCASIEGMTVTWTPALNISPEDTATTLRNTCSVTVAASEPRPVEHMSEIVHSIAGLVALAAQRPVKLSRIRGRAPDPGSGKERVIEIFRKDRAPSGARGALRPDEFLFTLADVQAVGGDFVGQFYDKRQRFRPVLEVLLSDRINEDGYVHQRFLGLAHGLEAFHRVFIGGKYTTDEEHAKDLLPLLLDVIPSGTPAGYRRSLSNKFKHANEYSLRKRITDLVRRFEPIIGSLISDVDLFADDVADRRNRLSHPDESTSLSDGFRELWLRSEQMRLLLELCVIRELGLGPETENRIVTSGRHAKAIRLNLP